MLNSLRKGASGWIAKTLMALLILSFAAWGIADMLRTQHDGSIARVGDARISQETFRSVFNNEMQRLSRQAGRPVTMAEARSMGLERHVLNNLVTEATLDATAEDFSLFLADQEIAKDIINDEVFQGADGRFNRQRFEEILRANGLSERGFIDAQRRSLLRRQLVEGLTDGVSAPRALLQAIHQHENETRSIGYIVLNKSFIGNAPTPPDPELNKFFDEHKADFRVPELRSLSTLRLDAAALASREEVSAQDARQRYDANIKRFSTPEKRSVQRIVFASVDEAQKAYDSLKGKRSFDDLAHERKLSDTDISFGDVAKDDILDAPVAEATFALPVNQVSKPVAGQFSTVLLRVTAIQPGSVKTFEAVQDELKREIALERAAKKVNDLHDQIEDARASGSTLAEVGEKFSLPVSIFNGVSREGKDAAGIAVSGLPETEKLLPAVFEADVGVETDAVQVSNTDYIWFEVKNVEAAHDRSFEEARQLALKAWQAEYFTNALNGNAAMVLQALRGGQPLKQAAEQMKLPYQTAESLKRSSPLTLVQDNGLKLIFFTALNKYGWATGVDPDNRVIFQVTNVIVPPFDEKPLEDLKGKLSEGIEQDLLTQYALMRRRELGTTFNLQALAPILGMGDK